MPLTALKGGRSSTPWKVGDHPGARLFTMSCKDRGAHSPNGKNSQYTNQVITKRFQELPTRLSRQTSNWMLPCCDLGMQALVYPNGNPMATSRSSMSGGRMSPCLFHTQNLSLYWYGGNRHRDRSCGWHVPSPAGLRPGAGEGRLVVKVGNTPLGGGFQPPFKKSFQSTVALKLTRPTSLPGAPGGCGFKTLHYPAPNRPSTA